jgi:hypothetical protein
LRRVSRLCIRAKALLNTLHKRDGGGFESCIYYIAIRDELMRNSARDDMYFKSLEAPLLRFLGWVIIILPSGFGYFETRGLCRWGHIISPLNMHIHSRLKEMDAPLTDSSVIEI